VAGTTPEALDDVRRCEAIGIERLTFDVRTDSGLAIDEHPRWRE
jgi:hypothetical protein